MCLLKLGTSKIYSLNISYPLLTITCNGFACFVAKTLTSYYLFRLSTCESGNSYDSGYSGRDSTASNMTLNPDIQVYIFFFWVRGGGHIKLSVVKLNNENEG